MGCHGLSWQPPENAQWGPDHRVHPSTGGWSNFKDPQTAVTLPVRPPRPPHQRAARERGSHAPDGSEGPHPSAHSGKLYSHPHPLLNPLRASSCNKSEGEGWDAGGHSGAYTELAGRQATAPSQCPKSDSATGGVRGEAEEGLQ